MLTLAIIAFIGGVIVTIAAQRIIDTVFDSPLPPMLPAFPPTHNNHEVLSRTWHTYHVTRDVHHHTEEPFWQHGTTQFTARKRYTGNMTPRYITDGVRNLKEHQYKTRGEIRGGRFFEIRSNPNIPSTFSLALFTDLNDKNLLVGRWMGLDWDGSVFTGAVIYTAHELPLKTLNQLAGTNLTYLDA